MKANIKLGRIWGIPIGLNWSWFLVFVLMSSSLAATLFPAMLPEAAVSIHWILGAVTTVLLFGSVLLHELGHAFEALRHKLPVRRITLFIFGGVAELSEDTRNPQEEFRIAIAGPIVSMALAVGFYVTWLLSRDLTGYLATPALYLARINLLLALFNLIPGFPLDGGRVLRAAIWAWSGSQVRATNYASVGGQIVAAGFMGTGAFALFGGDVSGGVWMLFIGWFLFSAASSAMGQNRMRTTLENVRVDQVLQPGYARVSRSLTIDRLVSDHVLARGEGYFLVEEAGRIAGIITLTDVARVDRRRWSSTTVEQIMTAPERLVVLPSEASLLEALEAMERREVQQVPVMRDPDVSLPLLTSDTIIGILSKREISEYLGKRSKLGLEPG
jgi:Zn-dependent protease/predicted transcriptional regulator